MKRPVVLAVARDAAAHAVLVEAVKAGGGRAGWLDLDPPPRPAPPGLEQAAAVGVLRAVAVADGRVTSVKPVRGEAVLDDLLREHFLGCDLVLVRGGEGLVRLDAEADGWRLTPPAGPAVGQTTSQLVGNLRRPSFWRRLEGRRP